MEYSWLNEVVNEVFFFSGRSSSVPVYLDLDGDIENEFADKLGIAKEAIEHTIGPSIESSLRWDKRNIYSDHIDRLKEWEICGSTDDPPFSALLLGFSVAAERMRGDDQYYASNFYQRLLDLLQVSDSERSHKLTLLYHCAKHTAKIWEALNVWLIRNDYLYGQPTASHFNSSTKYVAYAISQSLVRDYDRQRLRAMFRDYGLSRRDKIGESEMRLHLHRWMASSSGPSQSLRKLWAQTDLQERVIAAAISELENWSGPDAAARTEPGAEARLMWILMERSYPRRKVTLYLAARDEDHNLAGTSVILPATSPAVKPGSTPNEPYAFQPLSATGVAYLGPLDRLRLDGLLSAPLQLSAGGILKFRHDMRPIIPLQKAEDAPYYQEVQRLSPYIRHAVICHESWKVKVERFLALHAKRGFECVVGFDSGDLPPCWILFRNVEIPGVPSTEVENDLQVLAPSLSGTSFVFSGGLRLAPSIWHCKAPPTVFVGDGRDIGEVELRDGNSVLLRQEAAAYNPQFLQNSGLALDSKNLTIVHSLSSSVHAVQRASFRSARTPRWLGKDAQETLHYVLGDDAGVALGLSATSGTGSCSLRGMVIEGDCPDLRPPSAPRSFPRVRDTYEEEATDPAYDLATVVGLAESCLVRGHHYWIVDDSTMTCRDCRSFYFVVDYQDQYRQAEKRRHRARREETSLANIVDGAPSHRGLEGIVELPGISPDVILDAVCYAGFGSWESLQQIISAAGGDLIETVTFYRALVDLGLIDMELDEQLLRPRKWSCAPPSIVVTSDRSAFFSGFRNDLLLERISKELSTYEPSAIWKTITQKGAPTVHLWNLKELSVSDVGELVSDIRDPFGRPVRAVETPAELISSVMPSLDDLQSAMRPIHVDQTKLTQRFDVATGRWIQAVLSARGAYRAELQGTTYFFYDGNNSRQGGYELVKILAARDAKVALHGYDEASRSFECAIGCEPPGLFRRALVACSGCLPTKANGLVTYRNVSRAVAAIIIAKLYG